MYRRTLLVAVAGLSGCTSLVGNPLGGDSDSTDGSDGSSRSDSGTAETVTPESGNAGTAAGTPSEVQTRSPAELSRMSVPDLLALAREQLSRAVEAYADAGRSDTLTGVTAATDTFDPEVIVDYLYRARRAYEAADRQGLSAAVEDEIATLARFESFLRLSIDAQMLLIEAHDDLEGVVTAIEFVDPETAKSLTDRVGSRHQQAERIIAELGSARYERSTSVVDTFSRDEYLAKRDQLRAERDVLEAIHKSLPPVVEGVALFAQARGRRQSGAPYAAADLSRDAEEAFARGATALRGVGSRAPRNAQGFDGVVAALRAAAEDGRTEARAFYRDIET